MNNHERAVKVLHDAGAYCGECDYQEPCPECNAVLTGYVQALRSHGLLAPELPAHDRDGRWWPTAANIGNVSINPAGEIVLHAGNFRDMQLHLSPAKARNLARILEAAAMKSEREER